MMRDFPQLDWDDLLADDCRQLVRLAVREDLERAQDWTTLALVDAQSEGAATVVARQAGVVAGLPALEVVLEETGARLRLKALVRDGARVAAGARLATLAGSVRDLLCCERILLNFLGRLMGVATGAAAYVERIAGAGAAIYDTRKTTPGWRRLEKYAVRCGGARNHRTGLFDAILIKDNHLAQFAARRPDATPGEVAAAAVEQARRFLADCPEGPGADAILEVEVDSLEQLAGVLRTSADIVLLDNFTVEQLWQAVAMRNNGAPHMALEASGGVNLETVRAIAETGVDRISVGALTHGARSLDVGLDWGAL